MRFPTRTATASRTASNPDSSEHPKGHASAKMQRVGYAWIALLCACAESACGGSSATLRSGMHAPAWFHSPPKPGRMLYFVGDATQASDEQTARELAVQKAMAQLVVFVGAKVSTDFSSIEREARGKSEQVISMTVDVAGETLAVERVVVKETTAGRASDGTYDAYAIIEWPSTQYDAVLAAQRHRAERALGRFLEAVAAERALDLEAAETTCREAEEILGSMKSNVPLDHAEHKDSSLLSNAIFALQRRIASAKKDRQDVFSVGVECIREGAPAPCGAERAGAFRAVVSQKGLRLSPNRVPDSIVSDILASNTPTVDASLRSARFVIAIRYTAEILAQDGAATFVKCGARGVVFDTAAGKILRSKEIKPEKAGHVEYEGAMRKGFNAAEAHLVNWIEGELASLK